ncbi:MAG: hypothetical protein V7L23_15265 [Nostoc sp.]|uniref:phage tail tube protein n=1 Tax=Nostoc sp. TaxID=1180 RepID=UPI002FEFBC9A
MSGLYSQTITMENYTVGVLLLPQGSRDVTAASINITTAVSVGDTSISVLSSSPATVIKAGESLSFAGANPPYRQQVLIVEDTVIDNVTPTTLPIAPSKFVIGVGAIARLVVGILPLFGVQDFALQSNTTAVDITNVLSGTGTESKPIRNARTYQVSGKEFRSTAAGDPALQLIKSVDRNASVFARELYLVSIYPDGETIEGAAVIENFNQAGNYNNVKEYSFTVTLQGSTFVWIEPYV